MCVKIFLQLNNDKRVAQRVSRYYDPNSAKYLQVPNEALKSRVEKWQLFFYVKLFVHSKYSILFNSQSLIF